MARAEVGGGGVSARDDLIDRLVAEQHNGGGWRPTHEQVEATDDDLTAARRRRQMAEDFERLNATERKAR